jgi:hypothetical protein
MVAWPEGDAEPAKYRLATRPADTPMAAADDDEHYVYAIAL